MDSDWEDGSDEDDYDGEVGEGGSGSNRVTNEKGHTRGGTIEVMMIMTASICRRVTMMMNFQ